MPQFLLIAIGGGLASAVFGLSVRAGTPLTAGLTYFAPAPLLAVGLSRGLATGAIAALVGLLAMTLGVGLTAGLVYLVAVALPSLIVIRLAMLSRPGSAPGVVEWYPPGLLFAWLTIYAVVLLAAVMPIYTGAEGGLEGEVRRALDEILRAYRKVQAGKTDPAMAELNRTIALMLPGLLISSWLMVFAVNSAVAQGLLTRIGQSGRPTPSYAAVEMPRWLGLVLAGGVALALLPGGIGRFGQNALPILTTPFLLCGLAVIHTLSRRVPGRGAVLAATYLMILLLGWLSFPIALLGLAEHWLGLRRRFGNSGRKPEGE